MGETLAPDDMDQGVDLAGITVMADFARGAYPVADAYRREARYSTLIGVFGAVVCIPGITAAK